jgi:hypothetical protein
MKYFVHLALDEFGAEVAGKVHRELSTVSSPEVERHTFVWCGSGAAPAEPDYWASRFPPWNDAVEWPLDLIPQGSGWNLAQLPRSKGFFGQFRRVMLLFAALVPFQA